MNYNPFNTAFDKLTIDDLQTLIENEICEGWYIEYKSLLPKLSSGKLDNLKIAKSISSFANTKGGWIFWGIKCENNKPSELSGVDISEFTNFEDQVSQLINSNINPKPFYHFKAIELENGNSIFIIKVEESQMPPYITSQGVIYQRENNESKPIRERYIIEKLNEKNENYKKSIELFSQFNLPATKGQADSNQTYLELYLFPLPFGEFKFNDFYKSHFFKDVAAIFYQNLAFTYQNNDTDKKVHFNLGFNSIYSSEGSLIIRPLNDENLIYKSTTVELFENGNLKFLIPLYEFNADNYPDHYEGSKTLDYILNKYSPYDDFYDDFGTFSTNKKIRKREETDFVKHIKFIDGHELILTIIVIYSKYKELMEKNSYDFSNEIGFRAKITDCWRKFIFFDNEDYLEKIKLYNMPISPKSEIEIPEFKDGNSYCINLSESYDFIIIAKFIMEGIGLPDSDTIKFNEIIEKAIERFNE